MASVRGAQWNGTAQELLEPAWQMRWRAPELALMLGDRAAEQAGRAGDTALRLRAEALALFASNRLDRGVAATERAIAAVRDAESGGDTGSTACLRVELACCARSSGSHDVAVRVLQPVLEQNRIEPDLRAHALIELAASLPAQRRSADRVQALNEAERLYAEESNFSRDMTRLLRARVNMSRAGHHRRCAEPTAAAEATEAGLVLLEQLDDPAADSAEIHVHLVLERVQALLDLGECSAAMRVAAPVLWQPLRAAAAAPTGWLRLALATRLHLPQGEHHTAVRLLTEALAGAERHGLDDLQAEVLGTLSHVHEGGENFAEALRCVRGAYAADRRRRASVHAARIRLLEEFPATATEVAVPRQQSVPDQEEFGRQQQEAVSRHPSHGEDVRESVRRLMDTLVAGGDTAFGGAETRDSRESLPGAVQPTPATDPADSSPGNRGETGGYGGIERLPGLAEKIRNAAQREPADIEQDAANSVVPNRTDPDGGTGFSGHEVPVPETMFADPTRPATRGGEQRDAVPGEFGRLSDPTVADSDSWRVSAASEQLSELSARGLADSRGPADAQSPERNSPEPDASGPELPTPDVTTIMPVIPGPLEPEPEPFGEPEASSGRGGRRRQREHSEEESSSQVPEHRGPMGTAEAVASREATGPGIAGSGIAGSGSERAEGDVAHSSGTGRSAQGRSLAEIRAALQLVEEQAGKRRAQRSGDSAEPSDDTRSRPPEPDRFPEQASGRRHRAEPEDAGASAPAERRSAGDFLAKHRDLLQGLSSNQGSEQEAEPNGEAGLADLLAEALVAYESGKRNESEATDGAAHSAVSPAADHHSDPGGRRHRHAASGNPYSWTPPAG
ncbi:hypothetical protein [Haloactinomyces albus]|uniref:Tetratricopeptide repeat protein n=1 Tax=Haloactinomyces albus TaxID=1352928 RepID=A0AAE4CKR9_9ACTN|nr:hypothetical protein [Haloactinomyces albus]MDR7301044.1 hypothetical protein [Haloactinomyces albus]